MNPEKKKRREMDALISKLEISSAAIMERRVSFPTNTAYINANGTIMIENIKPVIVTSFI
jgi:hypothetical protein